MGKMIEKIKVLEEYQDTLSRMPSDEQLLSPLKKAKFFPIRSNKHIIALIAVMTMVEIASSAVIQLTRIEDVPTKICLPPNSNTYYKTPYLNFHASTNYLGYRGKAVSKIKQKNVMRILVVGNSFVYGWGLNDHETWPHQLQEASKNKGVNVEVINLGTPGTSTQICYESLEKALPLLSPDLVILGVLQGQFVKTHDPGEMHGVATKKSEAEKVGKWIHSKIQDAIRVLQPNFYKLVFHTTTREFVSANKNKTLMKRLAITHLSRYNSTPLKKEFDSLPSELKHAFLNGEINSSLLPYVVENKSYMNNLLTPDDKVDERIALGFSRIKSLVQAHDARLLVASMPYVAFGSKEQSNLLSEIGLDISPNLQHNKEVELRCKNIVEKNGIEFISVTDKFFKTNDPQLFLKYDGHFSKQGSELYANLLAEHLIDNTNVFSSVRG